MDWYELLAQVVMHLFRDLKGMICPVCDLYMVFPADGEEVCIQCAHP